MAQELRAKRTLDRLAILTAGRARAVRDGAVTEIALDHIVAGDMLELGLRLMGTEVVTGRAGAPIAEVIGALATADEAPNEVGRLLSARFPAPAGWTVRRRVPFSSARKWSGAAFDGHGTWLLGAPQSSAASACPAARVLAFTIPAGAATAAAALACYTITRSAGYAACGSLASSQVGLPSAGSS